MQKELAAYIMPFLVGTPGFSKFGGLVQTLETSEKATDSRAPVRYPVTLDIYPAPAEPLAGYVDFVPDTAESGLLYAEAGGLRYVGNVGDRLLFEGKLTLVAWMQGAEGSTAPVAQATANLLRRLLPLAQPRNSGPLTRIVVKPGRLLAVEDGLFSRYTYRQDIKQYLLAPFGALGIELTSTYQIHPDCLPA